METKYRMLYNVVDKDVSNMEAVTYSNFRKELAKYADMVNDEFETLIVTRQSKKDIVVMSKSEYDSWKETISIMSNPELMEKLREGDKNLANGGGVTFTDEEWVALLKEQEND
jgi:antitoxin YefM